MGEFNIKAMRLRFYVVFVLMGGLAIVSNLLLDEVIGSFHHTSAQVNIAGKQRMFIQHITLEVVKLDLLPEGPRRETVRQDVEKSLNQIEHNHHVLIEGDADTGIPKTTSPHVLRLIFGPDADLDKKINDFISAGRIILSDHEIGTPSADAGHDHTDNIFDLSEGELPYLMNRVVNAYQKDNEDYISRIKVYLVVATVGILISLMIVYFFIFRQALNRIKQEFSVRTKTEKSLTLALNKAEEASRVKSEFMANMSHEIRTPMNGVIGMLELLRFSNINSEQEHYVKTAVKSAEMQLNIINDILDFSKINAHGMSLNEVSFDPIRVVEEVSEMLSDNVHFSDVELTCFIDPAIVKLVRGDSQRFRQVITNLTGNAIKFTEKGEVSISLCKERETEDSVWLRFEVRDTGIGFTPETHEIIFKSFTQADSSTTRKYGGTGLGLSISSEIVKLMGGKIEAESTLGEGSRFWFSVPFIKSSGKQELSANSIWAKRVIIIDDNKTNREIFERYLNSWNISSVSAASGEEALMLLRTAAENNDPFDAAIVDFHMPGMDGLELGRIIVKSEDIPYLHTILLSSAPLPDLSLIDQSGFVNRLTKPVRQSDLLNALRHPENNAESHGNINKMQGPHPKVKMSSKYKVLLVDDVLINCELAAGYLAWLGIKPDIAHNGREALAMADNNTYDLVLMDVQMPTMSGFEATKIIRKQELAKNIPHLPIIAITAYAMKEDREKCLNAGMDDYISKPIDSDKFIKKVKFWLNYDEQPEPEEDGGTIAADNVLCLSTLSTLKELLASAPGNFERVLNSFIETTPELLDEIEDFVQSKNIAGANLPSHTLKSNSAAIGALGLSALAQKIERLARSNETGNIAELLDAARLAGSAAIEIIEIELSRSN
ncbi:MAG: response regulator [Rhodospirillaceae bacterium]|nr:response regulator [Rhodospirillaceae bacterium]